MYSSTQLAQFYHSACIDELQALKPGNVHIFADGHRMVLDDFLQSAEVSAQMIAQPNLTVGSRILNAVEATSVSVGKNTNLGIILLCAPIIHSALETNLKLKEVQLPIKESLKNTLENLTVSDAILASKAIVIANPAGLSTVKNHDVREIPTVNLLTLMKYAQYDDRIAWQYAHDFDDLFDTGLKAYHYAMKNWENVAWASTWVYLTYLCQFVDTHVVRKYGLEVAEQLMKDAKAVKVKLLSAGHPKLIKKELFSWDASLKQREINPGTSADLTVATLLLARLM